MLPLLTEIFVLVAAVLAAFFCLFACLVVAAMLRDLQAKGLAPKLLPEGKRTTAVLNGVQKAKKFLNRTR